MLNLGEALADHDFSVLEIPHFHIPSTEPSYLAELRSSLKASGIELWSLLIDDGDINHPEFAVRDRDWIESWIRVAATLGAKSVRVIGGMQPVDEEKIGRAERQLARLTEFAEEAGIKIRTENWYPTMATADVVERVLEDVVGLGLCFDYGNWSGPNKYEELAKIARFADSCHAKCNYIDGNPDVEDFAKCTKILVDAGYKGPFTLVHAEPGRVWESLDEQRELLMKLV